METSTFICSECGREKPVQKQGGTGYAVNPEKGEKICYECCCWQDRDHMMKTGKITLYLSAGHVVNWPGTLSFPVTESRRGRHNFARTRTDVWFRGPDGFMWHGVNYGSGSQICRCKRTKERWGSSRV